MAPQEPPPQDPPLQYTNSNEKPLISIEQLSLEVAL